MKGISFALEVKEEVASHSFPLEDLRAFLSGFTKCNGSLLLSNGKEELDLSSESSKIAKMLYLSIQELYGVPARFSYTRGIGFSQKVKYHVLVDEADYVLGDLEVDFFSHKVPKSIASTPEQCAAYLAGAFSSSGSVNNPASSNYHLEIAVNDPSYAKWLLHLFSRSSGKNFMAKITKRRKQWVIYLKRSDQISDFLVLIGAVDSCLKFENVRVDRDFANIGNRLNNLDNANLSKTMRTGERQAKEIAYFMEKGITLDPTNPKMGVLMSLRSEHPDASLEELASMLSEEFGMTVTKSNVNHLFRKIHAEYVLAVGEQDAA